MTGPDHPAKPAKARPSKPRFSRIGSRVTFALIAAGCAAIFIAAPRPVAPRELPALVLDENLMQQAIAKDRSAEEHVPSDELVTRLQSLYHEYSLAELERNVSAREAGRLQEQLARLTESMETQHGPDVIDAMRSRATEQAWRALQDQLPAAERRTAVGTFGQMLIRYGVVHDDRLVAPEMVVRALFKGRWNGVHSLDLTESFSPIELQAYWGWLLLHADNAPVPLRLSALAPYREAGGQAGPAVEAFLRLQNGEALRASELYAEAHEQTGALRYRNHALYALRQAE